MSIFYLRNGNLRVLTILIEIFYILFQDHTNHQFLADAKG